MSSRFPARTFPPQRTLALALVSACLAGCFQQGGSFTPFATVTKAMPLAPGVQRLVVSARVGDVVVSPAPDGQVRIEAEVRVRAARVDVTKASKAFEDHVRVSERDGALTIEDAHREAPDREDWSVALHVAMPKALPVAASTGVGNVGVETASGEVKASTGVGDVRLGTGDIASALLKCGTGNVEVKAGKVDGDFEALTGVGAVTAKVAGVGGTVVVKTGTGAVDIAFTESGPRGDVSATTGVGDVSVKVPASAAGSFSAKAGVGSVSVEGLPGLAVSRSAMGASASGTLGSGGPQYTVTVGTGNVTLRGGK